MRIYDEKKLNFNESSELILGRIEINDNDAREKLIEICSEKISNSNEKKIDINSIIIGGYLDLNSIEYEYDTFISDRVESAKLNMFLKCEINIMLNDGFEYSDEVYLESNGNSSYSFENLMSILGL